MRQPMARLAVWLLTILLLTNSASAYSVLTHEQIVDDSWDSQIAPQLRRAFPDATAEQVRQARAYSYGGCLIQDLGYYRFGNRTFSDLTHYVRTGDFVSALIRNASNVNEYAFALGALAHYASDNTGHPAVNRIVPLQFPKLARKYGDVITYAEDRKTHIRSEFGFDVIQVAKNRYTPEIWRSRIGFEVPPAALDRAFRETYGLGLDDVFSDLENALGTYRWAITDFVPQITKAALDSKGDEISKAVPSFDEKSFIFRLPRAEFEKTWGRRYRRPGILSRTLAFFIKIAPKIGPLASLSIKVPTAQVEDLYVKSYEETLSHYAQFIQQVSRNELRFPNRDFDTGEPTRSGEYPLADRSYAALLEKLAGNQFAGVSDSLRDDILRFYAAHSGPAGDEEAKTWQRTQEYLTALRSQRKNPG